MKSVYIGVDLRKKDSNEGRPTRTRYPTVVECTVASVSCQDLVKVPPLISLYFNSSFSGIDPAWPEFGRPSSGPKTRAGWVSTPDSGRVIGGCRRQVIGREIIISKSGRFRTIH